MEQPDEHFSLVGGNLVITNPDKSKHAGKYVCVAKNVYGTVISKEATVKFGCMWRTGLSMFVKTVNCYQMYFLSYPLLFLFFGPQTWTSFLQMRESRWMLRRDREPSCCVLLPLAIQVRPDGMHYRENPVIPKVKSFVWMITSYSSLVDLYDSICYSLLVTTLKKITNNIN